MNLIDLYVLIQCALEKYDPKICSKTEYKAYKRLELKGLVKARVPSPKGHELILKILKEESND